MPTHLDPSASAWATSFHPFGQFKDAPTEALSQPKPNRQWNAVGVNKRSERFPLKAQKICHLSGVQEQRPDVLEVVHGRRKDILVFDMSHCIFPISSHLSGGVSSAQNPLGMSNLDVADSLDQSTQ